MSDSYLEIKNVDFTIGAKIKVKNASFAIKMKGILCVFLVLQELEKLQYLEL